MRWSRRRFLGHRRPTALLSTISSPSSRYQTTAWRGPPSASTVAIVTKRVAARNSRTRGGRMDVWTAPVLVSSVIRGWYAAGADRGEGGQVGGFGVGAVSGGAERAHRRGAHRAASLAGGQG